MIFEIAEFNTGASCAYVRLPVFRTTDADSKRCVRNTERMNEFYKALAEYIAEFCRRADFPPSGKYLAESSCSVSNDGEEVRVSVHLSLHCRGRRAAARSLSHTWRDGVIVEDNGAARQKDLSGRHYSVSKH